MREISGVPIDEVIRRLRASQGPRHEKASQGLHIPSTARRADVAENRRAPLFGGRVCSTIPSFGERRAKDQDLRWRETTRDAVLLAGVLDPATEQVTRVLTLSFEQIPQIYANQPSGLGFLAGFDAPEIAFDHGRDTSFLMLMSPGGEDPAEVLRKFGSVDLK